MIPSFLRTVPIGLAALAGLTQASLANAQAKTSNRAAEVSAPVVLPGEGRELTVEEANELANQGVIAFEDGDFKTAAEKLARAYQARPLPSLGLWYARSLEKLGRLVEALRIYRQVQNVSPDVGNPPIQKQAQQDALTGAAELAPRVPLVTFQFQGAAANDVEVSVDGASVAIADMTEPLSLDPGAHRVEARRGDEVAVQEIELGAGENQTVTLLFEEQTPKLPPPPPLPPSEARSTAPQFDERDYAVWGTLGFGAVATAVGITTGIMAMAQRSSMDGDGCADQLCPAQMMDEVEYLNSLRTWSTVSFVLGATGLAAGAAMYFYWPSSDSERRDLAVRLGPTSAALEGRF